ncbi:uncharacterized protein LOC34622824 [Cyclospora cayetanensis]|uniref:Uncharacterized protein LOC34622824 n=1 Tax=Cyclospora cayetanensis TaxID=88456 RepID=A0A6P5WDB9_9EIME|nr:uncharacterized protein LOC34622824 [Cyclospora cayetanensis]
MASRSFPPLSGDDAAALHDAAVAAAASLGSCGWWSPRRVESMTAAVSEIGKSGCSSSLLSVADLLDSAADYMETLVGDRNKCPGCIYSGDAGLAYALIRKAQRLLAAAEREPFLTLSAAAKDLEDSGALAEAAERATRPGGGSPTTEDAAREEAVAEAEKALNDALSILSTDRDADSGANEEDDTNARAAATSLRRRFTFLQGHVGRLALTAVAQYLLRKEKQAFLTLRRLAAAAAAAIVHMMPEDCELLYGRAGLLYALLFSRVLWLPPPPTSRFPSCSEPSAARPEVAIGPAGTGDKDGCDSLFADCTGEPEAVDSNRSNLNFDDRYFRIASTRSFASGLSSWCQSVSFGRTMTFSNSQQEFLSMSSQRLSDDRQATRVLLLSLIAQLVGQLVAQGRVGAVMADRGSTDSLEPREEHRPFTSACAAFSRGSPLPLMYEWHGTQYLGAAHGICGILLPLLQAVDTLYQAAASGCFPGASEKSSRALAAAEKVTQTSKEEATAAAARLLACSSTVCSAMLHNRGKDTPFFCPAASAFLCCRDGLAAAATLRATVRRLALGSLLSLLRSHLTDGLNLKSSTESTKDVLVQWCHGAPGMLPLVCWAVELHEGEALAVQHQQLQKGLSSMESTSCLPKEQQSEAPPLYRRRSTGLSDAEAAKEDLGFFLMWLDSVGSVTWRRGLLTKGLGICHGIGGNGMSLLCAYKSSQHPKWLRRALMFALEGIKRHQQLLQVPDRPFSLFEGITGFAVFLRDCAELLRVRCGSTQTATFYYPGYQLPPLPWEYWRL